MKEIQMDLFIDHALTLTQKENLELIQENIILKEEIEQLKKELTLLQK